MKRWTVAVLKRRRADGGDLPGVLAQADGDHATFAHLDAGVGCWRIRGADRNALRTPRDDEMRSVAMQVMEHPLPFGATLDAPPTATRATEDRR